MKYSRRTHNTPYFETTRCNTFEGGGFYASLSNSGEFHYVFHICKRSGKDISVNKIADSNFISKREWEF